jgi:C4-dicarboxylate-binding protein DctP
MKTIIGKGILVGAVLCLALGVAGIHTVLAGEKVQVPSQMPVGHPITKAMDMFCKAVTEKSNGRLVLESFPAGQLLTDKEIPKAISTGTTKIAQTYFAWWIGLVPGVFPYGGKSYDDLDHYMRLYRGPLGAYQEKLLAEKGHCKHIAPILYAVRAGYILTKPVKKLGDMKGMKIRISTKAIAAETMALGGVPTVMSSADVYMALQRGTIQGAHSGLGSFYARKWYEVAKYVFLPRYVTTDFNIVANLEWFNSLSPDLQQIIMDAGKESSAACTKMVVAMEDKIMAGLKGVGVDIYEVPKAVYDKEFAPITEPALKAAAVKELGQELADQYDAWVEQTRAK